MFKLKVNKFLIEYDKNYGCNNRTGWSIALDGHYLVQLERNLIIALINAYNIKKDMAL